MESSLDETHCRKAIPVSCVQSAGQLYEIFLFLPDRGISCRVLCVTMQCGKETEWKAALMKHIVVKQTQFLHIVFRVLAHLAGWPPVIGLNRWKPNLGSFHLLLQLPHVKVYLLQHRCKIQSPRNLKS